MQTTLIALVFIVSILGYTFFVDENLYDKIIVEDGPVESLTAITLLIMSILVFIRILRSKRKGAWLFFNIVMAVGFFFGFGEEISWGQRIFSVDSGEFFLKYNSQSETNLHNLEFNGVKINKLVFSLLFVIIFTIYFLLFQPLYRRWPWFTRLIDKFGVPVPKLSQTIILAVSTAMIMFIPSTKKWELWEAVFVLVLFLVLLNPYNSREKLFPLKSTPPPQN